MLIYPTMAMDMDRVASQYRGPVSGHEQHGSRGQVTPTNDPTTALLSRYREQLRHTPASGLL